MVPVKFTLLYILSYFFLVFYVGLVKISRQYRRIHTDIYDPLTQLKTVSPFYDYLDSISEVNTKADTKNFSSNYRTYKSTFYIDDTDVLKKHNDLICNLSNLGYSKTNGEFVFPNYTYQSCAKQVIKPLPKMQIDLDTNTLTMFCEIGKPYYILEPLERKGRLIQYDEIIPVFKVKKYKNPVKLTTQEFSFGSCDGGETFSNAVHISRLNPKVLERVKAKARSLSPKQKSLIVFMLTIDSFSRRHFYRKLPKTVKMFNKGIGDFSIFDFKLHNVVGQSSVENIVPIFSGIL